MTTTVTVSDEPIVEGAWTVTFDGYMIKGVAEAVLIVDAAGLAHVSFDVSPQVPVRARTDEDLYESGGRAYRNPVTVNGAPYEGDVTFDEVGHWDDGGLMSTVFVHANGLVHKIGTVGGPAHAKALIDTLSLAAAQVASPKRRAAALVAQAREAHRRAMAALSDAQDEATETERRLAAAIAAEQEATR